MRVFWNKVKNASPKAIRKQLFEFSSDGSMVEKGEQVDKRTDGQDGPIMLFLSHICKWTKTCNKNIFTSVTRNSVTRKTPLHENLRCFMSVMLSVKTRNKIFIREHCSVLITREGEVFGTNLKHFCLVRPSVRPHVRSLQATN